jgi:orotidine-5'-phosphate decarboxylase
MDAKRGDIGTTSEQYAREAFERYGASAVTVNPYMGFDSIAPYLDWKDHGTIVLCRTSNAGGGDLQSLKIDGVPLYQKVAHIVADKWNTNGQCGLVVGATFPGELAKVRDIVGEMPLLVPGVGTQGGDVQATVYSGKTLSGIGMMINVSRAIIYAKPDQSTNESFAEAARKAALKMYEKINLYRF